MKVVGNVKPEEVPVSSKATFGIWTSLAVQAVEAHKRGEVLVVTCTDRTEYKKMANGMAEKIRQLGFGRQFTAVDEPDGSVRVYLQLTDEIRNGGVPSVAPPNRRPRRRPAEPEPEPEPEPQYKRITIGKRAG